MRWKLGVSVLAMAGALASGAHAQDQNALQAPATHATRPMRIRIGGNVNPPPLVSAPPPIYPPQARASGVEGNVLLRAVIGTDGSVIQLSVISGDSLLAQAAIDAVKQWKYQPMLLDDQPVEVDMTITVPFKLGDSSPDPQTPPPEGAPTSTSRNDISATPAPVQLAPGVQAAKLINQPMPVYPKAARRKKIQGDVVLYAIIDTDGSVESLTIISGDPTLVKAAEDAVRQWKYQPTLIDDKPVVVDTTITVKFQLD